VFSRTCVADSLEFLFCLPTTPATCLRGTDAADWPEENFEYREDRVGSPWARALKPPPLFMIDNCLLVWSNRNSVAFGDEEHDWSLMARQRGPARRAQFTVWRF